MNNLEDILQNKINSFRDESSQMFIVEEIYYIEDYYEAFNTLLVTDDENIAKQVVDELNKIGDNIEQEKEIYYKFRDEWDDAHPVKSEEYLKDEKWEAGLYAKQITQEMVAKRQLVKKMNERIAKRNQKRFKDAEIQMMTEYDEYAKEKGLIYTAPNVLYVDVHKYTYHRIDNINKKVVNA